MLAGDSVHSENRDHQHQRQLSRLSEQNLQFTDDNIYRSEYYNKVFG